MAETMRTLMEVQKAHDTLIAIILAEVPCPDFLTSDQAKALCDVLCWVLRHEHNQHFTLTLSMLDRFLARRGYEAQMKQ